MAKVTLMRPKRSPPSLHSGTHIDFGATAVEGTWALDERDPLAPSLAGDQ